MSYFGKWTCPLCDKSWTGSMGWTPPYSYPPGKFNELLIKTCGCSQLGLNDEDMSKLISYSKLGPENSDRKIYSQVEIDNAISGKSRVKNLIKILIEENPECETYISDRASIDCTSYDSIQQYFDRKAIYE